MSTATSVMADFTHAAVESVPDENGFTHVAGYTSGTDNIQWTASDWSKYADKILVRIEQGYGTSTPVLSSYDVLDVETGAWTPSTAAAEVKRRVEAGYQWTTLYGSEGTLESCATLIKAMGDSVWVGHVDCVLANWNLDQAQAAAIVGTQVAGMTCRAVQWASPTSNPKTLLPGTELTLTQVNADLNAVQKTWRPAESVPRETTPAPAPAPVPAPTPVVAEPVLQFNHAGVVVWLDDAGKLYSREVTSTDLGTTWK